MGKIVADESPKMIGAIQTYTDELYQAWLLAQPDDYLAATTAFDVWNAYQRLLNN